MASESHYLCVTPESHYLCVTPESHYLCVTSESHYMCVTLESHYLCVTSASKDARHHIYILWKQLQTLQHCNTFYLMQAAVLTVYKWWNLHLIIQIILSDKLNYNIFNIHIWGLLSATCKGISTWWIYVKPSRISNLKLSYICSCRVALSLQCVREDFVLSYYHINITWKVLFDNSMPFYDTFFALIYYLHLGSMDCTLHRYCEPLITPVIRYCHGIIHCFV